MGKSMSVSDNFNTDGPLDGTEPVWSTKPSYVYSGVDFTKLAPVSLEPDFGQVDKWQTSYDVTKTGGRVRIPVVPNIWGQKIMWLPGATYLARYTKSQLAKLYNIIFALLVESGGEEPDISKLFGFIGKGYAKDSFRKMSVKNVSIPIAPSTGYHYGSGGGITLGTCPNGGYLYTMGDIKIDEEALIAELNIPNSGSGQIYSTDGFFAIAIFPFLDSYQGNDLVQDYSCYRSTYLMRATYISSSPILPDSLNFLNLSGLGFVDYNLSTSILLNEIGKHHYVWTGVKATVIGFNDPDLSEIGMTYDHGVFTFMNGTRSTSSPVEVTAIDEWGTIDMSYPSGAYRAEAVGGNLFPSLSTKFTTLDLSGINLPKTSGAQIRIDGAVSSIPYIGTMGYDQAPDFAPVLSFDDFNYLFEGPSGGGGWNVGHISGGSGGGGISGYFAALTMTTLTDFGLLMVNNK